MNTQTENQTTFVDELRRNWPSKWQLLRSAKDWTNHRCVFGLSTGRTGTTSLEYALNLSPDIAAFHEPSPADASTYCDAYRDVFSNPDKVRELFIRHRSKPIGFFRRKNQVYAETNNFQFAAPVIAELMPNSVFLFFHRHPAEYVRSGMRRGWYAGHAWDSYRLQPRADDAFVDEWQNWEPFEKICWFWQACNNFFGDAIEALPERRTVTLSFDDIVSSRGARLKEVFDKVDVEVPEQQALARVYDIRNNEQTTGEFPAIASWSKKQIEAFDRIVGPTMQRLGYS